MRTSEGRSRVPTTTKIVEGVQWTRGQDCASHCNIDGNEEADEERQWTRPIKQYLELQNSKGYHKETNREKDVGTRTRHKNLWERWKEHKEERGRRTDERTTITVSRIRSGHHPDLREWQYRFGEESNPSCRKCKMADETPMHIITDCPRIHKPPEPGWSMMEAGKNPTKILHLWSTWWSLKDTEELSDQRNDSTNNITFPCVICTRNVSGAPHVINPFVVLWGAQQQQPLQK